MQHAARQALAFAWRPLDAGRGDDVWNGHGREILHRARASGKGSYTDRLHVVQDG